MQGEEQHIGSFEMEEEAAVAFDTVARELRGESAITNFKDGKAPIISRYGHQFYVSTYDKIKKECTLPCSFHIAVLLK